MSPPDYQYCCCCFPQLSLPGWCRCLYASVLMFRRRKKKHRLEISAPQDFQHRVHTSFDVTSGCYVGLPPQWQSVIDTLKRPRPLVDPSRITNVELGPKKVGWIISIISQGCCKCNGPVSDDQVPTPAQWRISRTYRSRICVRWAKRCVSLNIRKLMKKLIYWWTATLTTITAFCTDQNLSEVPSGTFPESRVFHSDYASSSWITMYKTSLLYQYFLGHRFSSVGWAGDYMPYDWQPTAFKTKESESFSCTTNTNCKSQNKLPDSFCLQQQSETRCLIVSLIWLVPTQNSAVLGVFFFFNIVAVVYQQVLMYLVNQ